MAHLRDGQLWARLVLFFAVVLAAIVVVANATKPPAGASTTPSPVLSLASHPPASGDPRHYWKQSAVRSIRAVA